MKSVKQTFVTTLFSMGAVLAFPALADPAKGLEIAEQRKAVDMGRFCRDHGNATSQQTGRKQHTPNAIEIIRSG